MCKCEPLLTNVHRTICIRKIKSSERKLTCWTWLKHHLNSNVNTPDLSAWLQRFNRPLWGHAGALAGGMIASFGFAPYAFRPALWVGLILFFSTIHSAMVRSAAKRGALFGIGYFGCGIYWIYYTLYTYASTPLWLSVAIVTALVVYLSLFPMLAAWLGASLLPKGIRRLSGVAVLLAAAEWARGTMLSGFPWVVVGQGSLDSPWAGYLPLLGVYGTGLVLLLSAGWIAGCLWRPSPTRMAWLGAVILIAVAGETMRFVAWSESSGEPVKVALIQANPGQDVQWQEGSSGGIQQTYRDLTQRVAQTPVIIWPEGAIPKFYREVTAFYQDIANQVLSSEATLLAGVFYLETSPYRSHTGVMNVKTGQRYGKRHLVPLGEYTPLPNWLGPLYQHTQISMNDLKPSEDRPLIQVHDHLVGVTVCYESIFPEITRLAFPGAAYLVNVSNDAWSGDTRGPWQHFEANRVRASETARDLLRVASSGVTAIIDAKGSVRAIAPQFERVVLEGGVQPREGITPYARFGEWPLVMLSALVLALCCYRHESTAQTSCKRTGGHKRKS